MVSVSGCCLRYLRLNQSGAIRRALYDERGAVADGQDSAVAPEPDFLCETTGRTHDVIHPQRVGGCPAFLEPHMATPPGKRRLERRLDRRKGKLLGGSSELGGKPLDE